MALIPGFMLDAVVALGALGSDSKKRWFASGFLFGKFVKQTGDQKEYHLYLVTNRHVLVDQKIIFARFDANSGGVLEFDVPLFDSNKKQLWMAHTRAEIDIAVIRINHDVLVSKGARFQFFQSDSHVLSRSACKTADVLEGNGIFLLGFPLGLVGESQNFVVSRGGEIARIRDCIDSKSDTFLLSVPNYPGNSGGPVITKPEIVAINGTTAYSSAALVGVISAFVPYRDVAVSLQTGRERVVFEENSGLAVAYPVDFLLDTISIAENEIKNQAIPQPAERIQPPSETGDIPAALKRL